MSTFPSMDPLGLGTTGNQMSLDPLYKSMLLMQPQGQGLGLESLHGFGGQAAVSTEEQEQL